ncbi:MAG: 50S ribosomal protein L17 [Prevotella sp.]|uniref:50S ribosomal protein L17 n=1 Tax=Hallella absiana TaxID=2925336 RepID=UPI0021C9D2B8|nr:50S ribosomal protein L17 [Hallella absiana]MDD5820983.1 50S ribosomal protein L17 [Prevotella sp.]
MRHNKKFNHLGRTASHRASMLANMASSLIMHKRITTTLAKAKALKKYVEPLITRSKNDTTTSRRVVFRYLQDKYAVKELFGTIAAKVADRPGGYTRVIKLGLRQGDAAEIAFIELVDFDENMAKAPKAEKKTRRSRRSTKKAVEAAPAEEAVASADAEKTAAPAEKKAAPAAKKAASAKKKTASAEKKAPEAEAPKAE